MKNCENYIKFQYKSLFSLSYAYLDTDESLADGLFAKHGVHVRYGGSYEKEGFPYNIILCKFRKKDEGNFLTAMKDLKNKMLLMGHPDYEQAYTSIFGELESALEQNHKGN